MPHPAMSRDTGQLHSDLRLRVSVGLSAGYAHEFVLAVQERLVVGSRDLDQDAVSALADAINDAVLACQREVGEQLAQHYTEAVALRDAAETKRREEQAGLRPVD